MDDLISRKAAHNLVRGLKQYAWANPQRTERRVTVDYDDVQFGLDRIPEVEAVPVTDLKEFAEDVAYQFGYYCQNNGRLHIYHGGLSTLEWAFDILGWDALHPVPEYECEIDGCHEHATCGTPTADGYKRVCGKHFRETEGEIDFDYEAED